MTTSCRTVVEEFARLSAPVDIAGVVVLKLTVKMPSLASLIPSLWPAPLDPLFEFVNYRTVATSAARCAQGAGASDDIAFLTQPQICEGRPSERWFANTTREELASIYLKHNTSPTHYNEALGYLKAQ